MIGEWLVKKKRRLDEEDDTEECMKFLESAHEEFVAEHNAPAILEVSPTNPLLKRGVAPTNPLLKRGVANFTRLTFPEPEVAENEATESSDPVGCFAGEVSSQVDGQGIGTSSIDLLSRPICRDPSGSVWAGVPTAIVGDSMLRGKEIKKYFGPWARVYCHEDKEALAQKPPADCERVFYVSAGNALFKHRVMHADPAFRNIRSEAFLNKVGGVLLLGSVELWDKLYAPTQFSGKTVNPSFFTDVTDLLKELDVPVKQLDDEFMNNLEYTSDVHLPPGKVRSDFAKHIEEQLVELSQSAAEEKGVDLDEYRNACAMKKAPVKPDCKWCRMGECWDH